MYPAQGALGDRHSQHSFAQIPAVNQARSVFNRSYPVKDTYLFDNLNPVFIEEILPGDTIKLNVKSFMRFAPQVVPLLDVAYAKFYFFFVPNRLVWDNWEKFNGAQDNPGDSTSFLIPQILVSTIENIAGTIYDHAGIPTGGGDRYFSALPFRAYNLIWNEWFRDQNLQNSVTVPKGDGPDSNVTYTLLKGAKAHDYFTSCLPWPQKGAAVDLPIGGFASVLTTGTTIQFQNNNDGSDRPVQGYNDGSNNKLTVGGTSLGGTAVPITFGTDTGLHADLSTATAATINQFREAIMYQSFLELDARGGTRYTEILLAHFGVVSPDARLQRPEYLSGGSIVVSQHPVPQTSASTGTDTPQANLASFATMMSSGGSIGFSKSFVEHGYVIGLVKFCGDVTYQQGMNRMWSRRTREDFFWPKLQLLGEQEVLNKEIFLANDGHNDEVFGYQERYAEYKYHPGEIRGQFRSNFTTPLDQWHLAQYFSARPALNDAFIQSATPIDRNLVKPDGGYPDILADLWFDLVHARPMATYGVPATLGRF